MEVTVIRGNSEVFQNVCITHMHSSTQLKSRDAQPFETWTIKFSYFLYLLLSTMSYLKLKIEISLGARSVSFFIIYKITVTFKFSSCENRIVSTLRIQRSLIKYILYEVLNYAVRNWNIFQTHHISLYQITKFKKSRVLTLSIHYHRK